MPLVRFMINFVFIILGLHEENAALKESMIQMTAELSLHSLPGDKDEVIYYTTNEVMLMIVF